MKIYFSKSWDSQNLYFEHGFDEMSMCTSIYVAKNWLFRENVMRDLSEHIDELSSNIVKTSLFIARKSDCF